jgi:hypothetical protein
MSKDHDTQDFVQCIPAETPIEEEVMDEEGEHRNPNRFELLSHPFLFNKYRIQELFL